MQNWSQLVMVKHLSLLIVMFDSMDIRLEMLYVTKVHLFDKTRHMMLHCVSFFIIDVTATRV